MLPGGHRFVDAPRSSEIYERGVVLTVDAAAAEQLPEPSASPAAMEVTGEDFVEREWDDELEAKLKRAWDRISGKGRPEELDGDPRGDRGRPPALLPLLRGYTDFYESTRPTRGSRRWRAT